MSEAPWIVVGLGNPGPAYAGTRHNVGAMATDILAARLGSVFSQHKKGRSEVVEGRLAPANGHSSRIVLAKPRSYMNESGGPVKALADFFKTPPTQLVVLHDELDIGLGATRVKFGGGDNGHNGLKSIRSSLGTGDFYRVRLGIGRPPGRQAPADFVLKPFASAERDEVALLLERAADAVESLIRDGLDKTQSQYNS